MLNWSLEPLDENAEPAFTNAATCKKWVKQLQFTNLSTAQMQVAKELSEFDRFPVRPLERMQVMEAVRETVHELQEETAKKLAGKLLPLSDMELRTLDAITGLWQKMALGYYRCLLAFEEGEKQLKAQGGLLAHRCLMYSGRQLLEYQRAGYEFDGEQWRQFHAVYLFAEQHGLLDQPVKDEFSKEGAVTTCRFVYLKLLLTCHARVQELSAYQQQLLDQWLSMWVKDVSIERKCAISRGDAPPLAIDPDSIFGLQALRQEFLNNENMRYLPMVPMSKQLRVKSILLQQGHTPRQLELGAADEDSEVCLELLKHLHKHWCEPRAQRMAERQGSGQEMQLRYGLEDCYSWMSPQPFDLEKTSIPQDTWRAEDLSILGARLSRITKSSARVGMNRIIAVRRGEGYQMAGIVWASVTRTGEVHMGIRFQPGEPKPALVKVSARPGEPLGRNVPGILLGGVTNLGIPPSLLIPRGVFLTDRELELTLHGNEKMRVRLKFSVERKADYERVSFQQI